MKKQEKPGKAYEKHDKLGKMKSVTNFSKLFTHPRNGISSPSFQY